MTIIGVCVLRPKKAAQQVADGDERGHPVDPLLAAKVDRQLRGLGQVTGERADVAGQQPRLFPGPLPLAEVAGELEAVGADGGGAGEQRLGCLPGRLPGRGARHGPIAAVSAAPPGRALWR